MNIDEMSDYEKSVALARLNPEWHVIQRPDYARVCRADRIGACLFQITKLHNFFTTDDDGNPHLMPFAWRVLNHVWLNMEIGGGIMTWWGETGRSLSHAYLPACDPARAQRLWLDKILSLAIDAGMVEETAVTHEPK